MTSIPSAALRGSTEHDEQAELKRLAGMRVAVVPELALLYAIPNGERRDKPTAGKLQAEGVKAGVPDLHLPVARCGYHGLWIEMKQPGRKPSEEQWEWIRMLREQGHRVEVCRAWYEAWGAILTYLGIGE